MKRFLVALLIACVPAAARAQDPQQPPEGTGRIAGRVTEAGTGRPLADAQVRGIQWVGGRGRQLFARADADGRFEFTKLVPGSYQVTAQAEGHLSLEFGQRLPSEPGRRVELTDGQQFTDADIALPRPAAVEGIVTDEFGDPVPGVAVRVTQPQMAAGKLRLMAAGTPNMQWPTDDRGRYRVSGLPPGDYYVVAVSGPFAGPDDPAGFGVTYFPGTTTPTEAKGVHLDVGQTLTDVSLSLTPAPMYTVSGVVTDAAGKAIPRATVALIPVTGGDVRSMLNARVPSGPDGRFTFRNMAPGSYAVQAFGPPVGGGSLARAPFASAPFTLAGDRDDLTLAVKPGAHLKGRLLFEGAAPPPNLQSVLVTPAPVEFVSSPIAGGGPPAITVQPDGTFDVENQFGLRVIRVNVGASAWILKSVTLAGRDVTDEPVDFGNGDVEGVDITLTTVAGTLSGTVTDDGRPAPDATVMLFADDASKWAFPSRMLRFVRPGPDGAFRAAELVPGTYLAIALPGVNPSDREDPKFLEAMRPKATKVDVPAGASGTVTLSVVKK